MLPTKFKDTILSFAAPIAVLLVLFLVAWFAAPVLDLAENLST